MPADPIRLAPKLVDEVLERLGLAQRPPADPAGLRIVYDAWCRRVPFDNVQKRIHIASASPAPLPGDAPADFFADWLRHGTGGTCWAGNGALAALLAALGFDVERGVGTMMAGPDPTPNHGTVVVTIEGEPEAERFLVDASILHGEPLALRPEPTVITHPAWGVETKFVDDVRFVQWKPFHSEMACRIDAEQASADEFRERHEKTRTWSPFNFALSARLNRGAAVVGAAFGHRGDITADGACSLRPFQADERTRMLVDEMGMSEEIVAALPDDEPMAKPSTPNQ